jgi:hypothetical protein
LELINEAHLAALALEARLAQGQIEKMIPAWLMACTRRAEFDRQASLNGLASDDFPLLRGLVAGAAVERELYGFAKGKTLTIDIDTVVDGLIAKERRASTLPPDRLTELRATVIGLVRGWQGRFPPEDGDRDWLTVRTLLSPQHDLFVRRPGRFAIRVRPDLVVGVADSLIAVEFSTARDASSISPARLALNHHALVRERLRRPEWGQFRKVATRLEMLASGDGFTIELSPKEAEDWRVLIGNAAEAMLAGRYEPNRGPHCSMCPWQAPCWFDAEEEQPF